MTTPYIDPNLIFAENAPVQDKPAAFQNYDRGMDETRRNEGRPLIPEVNYLHQKHDLQNLYIHENGAALPYKEGIAYEENAVVVKDGVLQQWKGGVWVLVRPDHNDLVGRDVAEAHPASAILDASGGTQQDINNDIKKIGYANFRDAREWGVTPDQTTDYTTLIRDIVQNQLDSYEVLYIPFGVRWNYSGIYSYLKDYQTIVDDSGRDEARNLWQSTRITWHKTNANTGATNGNTETVAGDYHPAYVVDTYALADSGGARASIVYRHQGVGKWQAALDFEGGTKTYNIAQYGAVSYGTVSLSIGHQDDPNVIGKIGFNSSVNASSMLFNFNKPAFLDNSIPFNKQYQQSAQSTGDFQTFFRYGTVVAYREDIKVDGTHQIISKNSRRITTTADNVRYGTRRNVKTPTASLLLTVDESTSFISNVGTSTTVTASLPKAAVGLSFEFSVDAAFALRVQPNAADNFVGLATGKYKESSTIGSKLRIVAISSTVWSFEQIGTWTDQV